LDISEIIHNMQEHVVYVYRQKKVTKYPHFVFTNFTKTELKMIIISTFFFIKYIYLKNVNLKHLKMETLINI